MDTFLSFLDAISTTKSAWVFMMFGLIGLFTSQVFSIRAEKRWPKLSDVALFIGFTPFVVGVAIQADISPWVSLVIGMTPDTIYNQLKKRSINFSFGSGNDMVLTTDSNKKSGNGNGNGNTQTLIGNDKTPPTGSGSGSGGQNKK